MPKIAIPRGKRRIVSSELCSRGTSSHYMRSGASGVVSISQPRWRLQSGCCSVSWGVMSRQHLWQSHAKNTLANSHRATKVATLGNMDAFSCPRRFDSADWLPVKTLAQIMSAENDCPGRARQILSLDCYRVSMIQGHSNGQVMVPALFRRALSSCALTCDVGVYAYHGSKTYTSQKIETRNPRFGVGDDPTQTLGFCSGLFFQSGGIFDFLLSD